MSRVSQILWIGLLLPLAISCSHPVSHRASPKIERQVARLYQQFPASGGLANDAKLVDRLAAIGPGAVPAIERRLKSHESRERVTALITLNRLNEQRTPEDFTEEMVRGYLAMLADPNVMVRTYAMESLIRAGHRFQGMIAAYRASAASETQQKLDIVLAEITPPR